MENYAIIADNGGSDLKYRDVVGEVYTFPAMYANILVEGTKFVYQRCGVSSMKVAEPDKERLLTEPHYFGTAEVGRVKDLGAGMFEAEIINYKHFVKGVPFRLSDGTHLEVASGQFWRNGVRRSQKEVYDEIVKASLGTIPVTSPLSHLIAIPTIFPTTSTTANRRVTAKNRSSVQVKDSLSDVGINSNSFANDCLEIVTNKTNYWLHSLIEDKYYLIATINGNPYREGILKIRPGLVSKDPIILSDKKFGIFHESSKGSYYVGSIEVRDGEIVFHDADRSQKTVNAVKKIAIAIAL